MLKRLLAIMFILSGLSKSPTVYSQRNAPILIGAADCSRTDDCNQCVEDVDAAMRTLRTQPTLLGFHMNTAVDVSDTNHWSGIQRLSVNGGNFMVVARRNESSTEAIRFVVVEMVSRKATDQIYGSNRFSRDTATNDTPPLVEDRIVLEESASDLHNSGGIQAIGSLLAIPLSTPESSHSEIVFYDVGDPFAPRFLGTQIHNATEATAVAIARLQYGEFLLTVYDSERELLNYYSASSDLRNRFATLDTSYHFQLFYSNHLDVDFNFRSINYVTQCNGTLFLIGMANNENVVSQGSDLIRWFRVTNGAGDEAALYENGVKSVSCKYQNTNQCDFNAATGIYVTSNHSLLLYSTERDNDGPDDTVRLAEFRPTDLFTICTAIDQAWVELYDNTDFAGRSIFMDVSSHPQRNFANYDLVDGFEDKASSVRWCIPQTMSYTLYKDKDCSGETLVLNGTGHLETIADLDTHDFSDTVSSSNWTVPEDNLSCYD